MRCVLDFATAVCADDVLFAAKTSAGTAIGATIAKVSIRHSIILAIACLLIFIIATSFYVICVTEHMDLSSSV